MAKLLLHIGSPKTGSSAIQKALGLRKEQLQSRGIALPEVSFVVRDTALDSGNGEWLANFCTGIWPADSAKGQLTLSTFHALLDQRQDTVLSSENFYYSLDDTLAHVGTLATRAFEQIHIVLYLRNPVDMCFSLWLQGVKRTFTSAVPLSEYAASFVFEPVAAIRRFERAFPGASISVRNYDRLQSGLVQDFLDTVGGFFQIDTASTVDDHAIVNRSLYSVEVAFMQALTDYMAGKQVPPENILSAKRISSDAFLAWNSRADVALCPREVARGIAERARQEVQAVNDMYGINLPADGQAVGDTALPGVPDGFSQAMARIAGDAFSRIPPSLPVVHLREGSPLEFEGYVDHVSSVFVSGWAVCKSFPTSPVLVLVAVGSRQATLVANIFRQDVAAARPGYSPYCGFYYEFDGNAAVAIKQGTRASVTVLGSADPLPCTS